MRFVQRTRTEACGRRQLTACHYPPCYPHCAKHFRKAILSDQRNPSSTTHLVLIPVPFMRHRRKRVIYHLCELFLPGKQGHTVSSHLSGSGTKRSPHAKVSKVRTYPCHVCIARLPLAACIKSTKILIRFVYDLVFIAHAWLCFFV